MDNVLPFFFSFYYQNIKMRFSLFFIKKFKWIHFECEFRTMEKTTMQNVEKLLRFAMNKNSGFFIVLITIVTYNEQTGAQEL